MIDDDNVDNDKYRDENLKKYIYFNLCFKYYINNCSSNFIKNF